MALFRDTGSDRFAICLYFDPVTELVIRDLWRRIARAGISSELPDQGWRPHITLSRCSGLHLPEFHHHLEHFAAQVKKQTFTLSCLGSFYNSATGYSAYLGVLPTSDLIDLHKRHHAVIAERTNCQLPYYTPAHWVPHCTLAIDLSSANQARITRLMSGCNLPIFGTIETMALVQGTRPQVRELATFALGKAARTAV